MSLQFRIPRPSVISLALLCCILLNEELRLRSEASQSAVTPLAVFTVNSIGDGDDTDLTDGICNAGGGLCTLRAAIQQANADPGPDTINFAIPGAGPHIIAPAAPLPVIATVMTIDGYTQPGAVPNGLPLGGGTNAVLMIELNGAGAGAAASGLVIVGGMCTVKGLVINRFQQHGIVLVQRPDNKIEGNFIGTNVAGTAAGPGNSLDGVHVLNGPNTIGGEMPAERNLISGNGDDGVEIAPGGIFVSGNSVLGNLIGTNAAGAAALANAGDGVVINDVPNNTIGGAAAGAGNVISGNGGDGVEISGPNATDNSVLGNRIGTNAPGAAAVPNTGDGVLISDASTNFIGGAAGTTPGGPCTGECNLISGNAGDGVEIRQTAGGSASGNLVRGNFIGVNAAGNAALGNLGDGVFINGAPTNTIGGVAAGEGNVISGNGPPPPAVLGNGVTIAGSSATNNKVQGNLIGTNAAGAGVLANTGDGVHIFNAPANTIGAMPTQPRNVISGNLGDGIDISAIGATGNLVQSNFIGVDATGAIGLGNLLTGVNIANAPNNTVGGLLVAGGAATNVISDNGVDGVSITGAGATGNKVQSNRIGVNAAGTAALGNGQAGVRISGGAQTNDVGGSVAGEDNLISGNGRLVLSSGVLITGVGTDKNRVQGNLIGANITRSAAIPNTLHGVNITGGAKENVINQNRIEGNAQHGVSIVGVPAGITTSLNEVLTNFIGSSSLPNGADGINLSAGARFTIISGNSVGNNAGNGVTIDGPSNDNTLTGNAMLGNQGSGVVISNGAAANTIGGTLPAASNNINGNFGAGVAILGGVLTTIRGNTITFNGDDGVSVMAGLNNAILSNFISANGTALNPALGIDLFSPADVPPGVTPNDPGDTDAGPNNLQNFPILTSVGIVAGNTTIQGTLNSAASTMFRIEFFSNAACDPSGHGEGQNFLGFTTVATDGSGNASFTATFPVAVPPGNFITATATDLDNLGMPLNTSEFSQCFPTCEFTISPLSQSFPASGGTGAVSVTTAAGCGWMAVSNAPWITITSGSGGTGNGTVNYSVAANTGPARTGTMTIAGQTFTVNEASGCVFTLDPASRSFPASGGSGSVTVTASDSACMWNAISNDQWITITAGGSGTGNGTVSYSVASNTSSNQRMGTMTIAGLTFTVTQDGSLQYYPLPFPVRLLDTRPGETACYAPGTPLGNDAVRLQPAVGSCLGATIPTTAKAVVGNATVVNFISTGFHWITLYPSDAAQPNASNLNFSDNQIVPNNFTVGLGPDGAFKIYSHASTHFIVDITGYYAPPGTGGLYYHPLPAPVRLFESRPGESGCDAPGVPLGNDATRAVTAHGTCSGATIPSSAKAIVGNATVVNFISSGSNWITLYPFGQPQPNASNLNFTQNQIVPNWFVVGLSGDGKFNIYSRASTHFIVDVAGYFSDEAVDVNGAGLLYNPLPAPVRLLDTRPGESACDAPGAPLGNDATRTQTATVACSGVPASAKAVVGNATVVNFISTGFHWITLYPFGAAQPNASNLNFHENHIVPNAFWSGLSNDGKFSIYSHASTHFIVDLTGYFAP